jgi:CRISPR-associated protein Csb2
MVTFELSFLAGRFHATSWDRHVNEGVVEWPISPWRILRALMAVGFRKLEWDPANLPEAARKLIGSLSEKPPHYSLPPASTGHTRHYMPKYRSALDGKTDKVIDAFVVLDPETSVLVHWADVELAEEEQRLLAELLTNLSFLGRAESWVEARLLTTWNGTPNSLPTNGSGMDAGTERVSLLGPMAPHDYATWRKDWLESARNDFLEEKRRKAKEKGKPVEVVKLSPKEASRLEQGVAPSLFDALLAETGDLRASGWNQPPGSRWVDYSRPADCFTVRPARRRARRVPVPTVARFALASESVQADVRPRLVDALYLADNMRRALMSLSRSAENGVPSQTFSGKTEDGGPLNGHQHAYILPVDDDEDGRVEGVIVYAPKGFSEFDRVAMGRLRNLWQPGGRPGLLPVLTGMGQPEEFGGREAGKALSPILAESRIWESRTPFVLIRHPKVRKNGEPKLREDGTWTDGPVDQLRTEMKRRGLPEPERIEWVDHTECRGKKILWRSFARIRKEGGGARAGGGYGFRVAFPRPVRGPIALGYGCHFGLGQFRAIG